MRHTKVMKKELGVIQQKKDFFGKQKKARGGNLQQKGGSLYCKEKRIGNEKRVGVT